MKEQILKYIGYKLACLTTKRVTMGSNSSPTNFQV